MSGGMWREWALVLLAAAGCAGETSQISGPVSGYVFDGARREVRPILGIPGASTIGDALDFGFAVSAAYVAPRQDRALVTAADGTVHLFRIQSGSAAELVLNGFARAPERVVFSPSGTAAALYHSGSIEILNGLADSPVVTTSLELTTADSPTSMALSDDGALVLLAWGTSVGLFASGANLGTLTDTAGPAAVTFAPGTHDAAVADPLGSGIVWFRDLTGASDSQVVAVPDDTIQSATAVAFSADGRSLLVASPAGQSVTRLDLAQGTRTTIPCACAPTALAPVGSLFRLTEFSGDPLWLLDTQQDPARTVFVPVAPAPGPAPRSEIRLPRTPLRGLHVRSE